ncbi:MAG: hypothetical protein JL50_08455 [Peptococcaceae bacterium BICA1-7]|nr:MAG: hypothetical protein JL50_08455 [Peptococcaceae bacterium BICA1-7]HBV97406.1 hypothetical protein [Desulfotomaculum sp.]
MGGITATVMDKSLIVGAGLLGVAVLGGIFHFIQLGLFSAGMEKGQAGVLSGVLMGAAVVLIYKTFFL